ncbi:MAG: type VI secretion system baseplate subunit TssF [Gammaproteobacteria bacterium]|nr:type VI secretion system baseplate subunit TssF [Gammaproteobacteria bacterium]MDH5727613.1 type VI secretion system baseplate subunit TssF [Gammaproteobacteria bacterium]
MEFNKYYQDELTYLREMGIEFARYYPKLAPFLGEGGNDPDVERLLEGFAFLSGRLRQKLDDELPELTEGMFSLMWPQYIRPIPATSILQFTPIPSAISNGQMVKRGAEIDSDPVDGTRCRFRTCFDVDVYPIYINQSDYVNTGAGSVIQLQVSTINELLFDTLDIKSLKFFLHGDTVTASSLYLWLNRYLKEMTIEATLGDGNKKLIVLDKKMLKPAGLSDEEVLIPYPENSLSAYRLLQEYYTLPQKFLFVELVGMHILKQLVGATQLTLSFKFSRPLDSQVRPTKDNFRLFCTPIVNLFEKDADPVRLDNNQVEYFVRPGGDGKRHFEIFSIDRVTGWVQGTNIKREYKPFLSFTHNIHYSNVKEHGFFKLRRQPAVIGKGIDTYATFVLPDETRVIGSKEVISLQLTCSNRNLPEKLREHDIKNATGNSPEFVSYRNITAVTPSVPPPVEKGLHWNLISNLTLNYETLSNITALRHVLSAYNFPAHFSMQAARLNELRMEGLKTVKSESINSLVKGVPVRGQRTRISMDSSKFACEGDMYLFAAIIERFLGLYVTINSFSQLWLDDIERGEIYQWEPLTGMQTLL